MKDPYIEALKVAQETIEIHRSQVMALNTQSTWSKLTEETAHKLVQFDSIGDEALEDWQNMESKVGEYLILINK